jgi:hypothetical protein
MTSSPSEPGRAVPAADVCLTLRLLIAVVGLALMRQTRGLWFPSPGEFPQVPLVSWCSGWPRALDDAAAFMMAISLLSLFFIHKAGKISRASSFLFAGALVLGVLLNQHRLQPWALQFGIFLVVMAVFPAWHAVLGLRLIVVSMYLHSGLSKLDASFLATHGEVFMSQIASAFDWNFANAPLVVRRIMVAILPLGEIAIAVGLCVPKTRHVAKWFSVGMHAVLLSVLGPWGLDQQPGVLIWNGFFIVQNLVLFYPEVVADSDEARKTSAWQSRHSWRMEAGSAFVMLVVLLPFLEPFGYYDHWPAWAVYASRPERTRVYVAENRVGELPVKLREFVIDEEPPADALERFLAGIPAWKRVRIDRWSLEVLNAPLYPQDRFHIGVALALAEEFDLGDELRVEIDSPAHRFTGKRSTMILEGAAAVREHARRFRLNALPRQSRVARP